MNYTVTDKDGWTLAEGCIQRIQRNREEAARIVERIERNQRIERLVRASSKGSAEHLLAKDQPASNVVDFLHYRSREFHAPMATRKGFALASAAINATWLTAIGLGVGFLSLIVGWILG